MERNIDRFWRIIHEEEENPDFRDIRGYPLWRLFKIYYLRPYRLSLVAIVLLGVLTGQVMYGYARAGQFIADDIIELALIAPSSSMDPTLPSENRTFQAPQRREITSVTTRLETRPGKTVAEKVHLLSMLALMLAAMEIARHTASAIVITRTVVMTQKAQFKLRQQLHDKLQALPMHYHDRHSPGRLLTHLFSDMQVVQNSLSMLMRQIPPNIAAIVVGAVIVMVLDTTLGGIVLCALPCYGVVHHWFRARMRRVNRNIREREGKLNAHIANRVGNFQLVKSYGRESGEGLDFLRQARPILNRFLAASVLNTVFVSLCGIISGTCVVIVLWMGALRVRDGLMTPGELLMFHAAAGYMFNPVSMLTNMAAVMYRVRAVAGKVMRVLDEPITLTDPEKPQLIHDAPCALSFDRVTLTYGDEPNPALNGASFTLPAGKRLCVMGPSGAGKTTLAKLCARFYDPSDGAVRLDGVDLKQFRVTDLRQYIGYVGQEPIVFSGTISGNIRYGANEASPRAVVAAAQYAQIHDFIERLPERYQTLTHERGLNLSGGQKQRVNLARALINDSKMLILDDCTSALDADTEAKLVHGFRDALDGRTCVLVTHRVSIAMTCDYVLMLDSGKVAQFGDPQSLAQSDGPFAKIVREQAEKIRLVEQVEV
jgi:ABC-type multidrug transport system fused ATPase/permease subunit